MPLNRKDLKRNEMLFIAIVTFCDVRNYMYNFYILIREDIRFMQNWTPPPPFFIKSTRFETP